MSMLLVWFFAVGLLAVASALAFFAARLLESTSDRRDMSLAAALLRIFGWCLTVFTLLVFFFFNLLGFGVAIAAIVITLVQRRIANQDSLLWILALSARRKMPLVPAVLAYADQCQGFYRIKVLRLEEMLRCGVPLGEAVTRLRGLLPAGGVAAAAVGAETDALAGALAEQAACRARRRGVWQAVVLRIAYISMILVAVTGMVFAILFWIMPQFVLIFNDFEIPMPPMTVFVVTVSQNVVRFGPAVLLILSVALAALLALPYAAGKSAASLPLVGWIIRRYHGAAVLRALATVAESNRPLEFGLEILGRAYPTRGIWPRIQKVEAAVRSGASCWPSLAQEGLIGPGDVAVLEAAGRVGNLPWALRETAHRAERRIEYRVQAWSHLLFPLAVMAAAAVVALLVVGIMWPLISLIERMAIIA